MNPKKDIPVYNLEPFSKWGIFIRSLSENAVDSRVEQAHRDENYIFIFQESGKGSFMVDFKEIILQNRVACCVFPGQVHYEISNFDSKGFIIALNNDLVPDHIRTIFDQFHIANIPFEFDDVWAVKIKSTIELLNFLISNPQSDTHDFQIIKSVCHALATMFGSIFQQLQENAKYDHHSETLTHQFKSLLQKHFKTMKAPREYANSLNISPAYLNQVVKKHTGMPLSYWIQQEIILEAKRLLFFTNHSSKEIAFILGYEDPAYFSRLFIKSTGVTPLSFRENSKK
jgi:AraC family transcriptional activator of pobA